MIFLQGKISGMPWFRRKMKVTSVEAKSLKISPMPMVLVNETSRSMDFCEERAAVYLNLASDIWDEHQAWISWEGLWPLPHGKGYNPFLRGSRGCAPTKPRWIKTRWSMRLKNFFIISSWNGCGLHFTSKPREQAVFPYNPTNACISTSFIVGRYAWDYVQDVAANHLSWFLWIWLKIDL